MSEQNHRVYLNSRPGVNGSPCQSNFGYEVCPYPQALGKDFLLIQTLYISIDPAMRCRMNEDSGVEYAQAFKIGGTILGPSVGVILESKSDKFETGDFVTSTGLTWPWQTFVELHCDEVMKLQNIPNNQWSLCLGVLGFTGLTAALGILEKGNIKPGMNQTVVVSGAAGACGSVAGQVAKIVGCGKLIGICGTKEKCNFLTKDLKFDAAICYKSENVKERLSQLCSNGVDVYFDNVGGDISDKVIAHMNHGASIILCGQISIYNTDVPYPPPLCEASAEIVKARLIHRDRFLVLNYYDKFAETLAFLGKSYAEGKIISRETIEYGLENAGKAFVSLMSGSNIGKQIVKL